jgi:hypothetical protein
MITEIDEARSRIDEVIRDTTRTIRDAKARGGTTKLLSFEDMFRRILESARKDPRIGPKDQKTINDYAESEYKKIAKAEGFSEHVVTDASVLRGHVVHLMLKIKSGEVLESDVYADERIAIAKFNDWMKAEGEKFTAQDIRIFEASVGKDGVEESDHPLLLTKYFGSGVRTCPIR